MGGCDGRGGYEEPIEEVGSCGCAFFICGGAVVVEVDVVVVDSRSSVASEKSEIVKAWKIFHGESCKK